MNEPNSGLIKSTPEFELASNAFFWHAASFAGVAMVLFVSVIQSLGAHPLQYRSLVWLVAGAVLVPIAIRFVFPVAWSALFRNPSVLVPFGIVWFISMAIGWLSLIPFLGRFLAFGWHVSIFGLSLNASIHIVLYVCIWSAFACWQIDLIWQTVRHGRVIDISPWPRIRSGFWRALSVLVFGTGILLLALIPGMAAGVFGILTIGIVWNVMTVALLPIVLMPTSDSGSISLLKALKIGLSTSWRMKRKWWLQLAVLLTLLGMMTYVMGSFQNEGTYHSNSSFTITAFWAGAFDNDFRWHSKYMAMIQAARLPFAVAMLELLFMTLAISMKIHVITKLHADAQTAD